MNSQDPHKHTPLIPYQGWAWRGAKLEVPEIAAYTPGKKNLHLGIARARLDQAMDFPVLFRVYAHHAWVAEDNQEEIIFPPNTEFWVREFQKLPKNRVCFFLEQVSPESRKSDDLSNQLYEWVKTVAPTLPKPLKELERAWDAPFARWSPGAKEGEAPLTGDERNSHASRSPESEKEEGSFDPEDCQDGACHEGHGDHWSCIFPEIQDSIQNHLSAVIENGNFLGVFPARCPEFNKVHAISAIYGGELGSTLLLGDNGTSKTLATAFPLAGDGISYPLKITKINPWSAGLEATVEAETSFGASLCFFPVNYYRDARTIKAGQTMETRLSAFAYWLEKAESQSFQISNEETIRLMRAAMENCRPEEVTDLSPVEIYTQGMSAFFQKKGWNPDDFQFHGPICEIDVLHAWEQLFYRLTVAVMIDVRDEEEILFTLPVYVAKHNLPEGYRPKVGDDVQGMLWLQGLAPFIK